MRKPRKLPDLSLIENRFQYDPLTGAMWKDGKRCRAHNRNGYNTVYVRRGMMITVARLGWYLYYRQDPGDRLVKHINGDKKDDRIENLKLVRRTNGTTARNRIVDRYDTGTNNDD